MIDPRDIATRAAVEATGATGIMAAVFGSPEVRYVLAFVLFMLFRAFGDLALEWARARTARLRLERVRLNEQLPPGERVTVAPADDDDNAPARRTTRESENVQEG